MLLVLSTLVRDLRFKRVEMLRYHFQNYSYILTVLLWFSTTCLTLRIDFHSYNNIIRLRKIWRRYGEWNFKTWINILTKLVFESKTQCIVKHMTVYIFIEYLRVQCIVNHMPVFIFIEYLRVQRVLFPDRPGTAAV